VSKLAVKTIPITCAQSGMAHEISGGNIAAGRSGQACELGDLDGRAAA
jgi:hypothetical protein